MFPCGKYSKHPISRRDALSRIANGFGSVALTSMLHGKTADGADSKSNEGASIHPLAPRAPHFAPKAKRVIMLF